MIPGKPVSPDASPVNAVAATVPVTVTPVLVVANFVFPFVYLTAPALVVCKRISIITF